MAADDLLSFAYAALGRVVTAPGGMGGQCVDLCNLWLVREGCSEAHRNAKDWAGGVPGTVWVPNAATNSPPAGAVVVWVPKRNVAIDPNGHVAIAVYADVMHLVTLDQNWPDGAPVSFVLHTYAGVAGWCIPQ